MTFSHNNVMHIFPCVKIFTITVCIMSCNQVFNVLYTKQAPPSAALVHALSYLKDEMCKRDYLPKRETDREAN